jgi:hypothetical protein
MCLFKKKRKKNTSGVRGADPEHGYVPAMDIYNFTNKQRINKLTNRIFTKALGDELLGIDNFSRGDCEGFY